MAWHVRLKDKAVSNREAAKRLFPEWKRNAREEVEREGTSATALANRIGLLSNKGDPTGWWRDRPFLKQLLADLVELEVDEIFGAPSGMRASLFREFPALPPLAGDESPCRTSPSGSVFDLVRAALGHGTQQRHWIVVPPGGGKSLAVELLRSRFPGEVSAQTVVRLGEAVAFARDGAVRPIVVEVEESDPANDETSVRALELHRASVVVLAAFSHPDEYSREGVPSRTHEASTGWNGKWGTIRAVPDPDWIVRMLRWVDARLSLSPRDTKFDKDAVLAWLNARPSVLRAIESPGDLLSLCADFDAYGRDGSPRERAERWLRSIGVKALPPEAPRSWVAYESADCVSAMMVAHAFDRATALHERSFAGWAGVVPSGALSSENTPGPTHIVGFLRSAGLLRADQSGAAGFPKWIAGAFAQHDVVQLVRDGDVRAWGAIAGDASRQGLVDDALDALRPGELCAAGEALLSSTPSEASTFAQIGALEALVAALGRRLVGDASDRRSAELAKRALVRQLEHLVSGANIGERRVPMTRRNHDRWFLSAWAISLATSGAGVEVPKDLRWELPGWSARLRLSEVEHLNHFPWSSVAPWGASDTVRALMPLTRRAVERVTPSEVPTAIPRLLLPALVLEGWTVTPEHLEQLAGTWEETVLAGEMQRLEDERRRSLAEMFWKLASDAVGAPTPAPVAERIAYLQNRHASLLPPVLASLPAVVVEETARTAGAHRRPHSGSSYPASDPGVLRHLSLEQRAAAVRGRLSNHVRFDEVRELLEVLDGDDLDVVLDVVRVADRNVAAEFANRVWRLLPERAEEEARHALTEGLAAAEAWFRTAPRARIGALIEVASRLRERPHWVQDWALARLLDAGIHAESLFHLSRRPRSPATRSSGKNATKRRTP